MPLKTLDALVEELGVPKHARRLSTQDAERFRGRVPDALIAFWTEIGCGSYQDGFFVICDPRPFQPVIQTMFRGDPELNPDDITAVGYTGDSNMFLAWHADGRKVIITLDESLINMSLRSADIDQNTGEAYSQEQLVGAYLSQFQMFDAELFDEACRLHGTPAEGEIFGFVPALQLGGSPEAETMQRVEALEHIAFLAQLMPLRLVVATAPDADNPIGQNRVVRNIGRQS